MASSKEVVHPVILCGWSLICIVQESTSSSLWNCIAFQSSIGTSEWVRAALVSAIVLGSVSWVSAQSGSSHLGLGFGVGHWSVAVVLVVVEVAARQCAVNVSFQPSMAAVKIGRLSRVAMQTVLDTMSITRASSLRLFSVMRVRRLLAASAVDAGRWKMFA